MSLTVLPCVKIEVDAGMSNGRARRSLTSVGTYVLPGLANISGGALTWDRYNDPLGSPKYAWTGFICQMAVVIPFLRSLQIRHGWMGAGMDVVKIDEL